jgi:4-amino-4-deoxy-L-arabinose transferase-like glycosyltransferase
MTEPDAPSTLDRLLAGWRAYVLVGLIALIGALPGVARLPVLDRDEARFTQATRQMLETGDFVRIRVQDTDRNKKPIGIHWLQAAAVTITEPLSHSQNAIWAYRIPSIIGVILAALAALWAGLALLERRTAVLGAILFAGCIILGVEGMIAKTDGFLVGITTLTLAALARLYAYDAGILFPRAGEVSPQATKGGAKTYALLFWIALGVGVLIKGPVTPMVVTLTLITLALWERRAAWMKPLVHPIGMALCVLIVAPWMIAIGIATHGAFFVEAIGGDLAPKVAGGQEGHFAWPGTHLVLLPLLIFPATFALPGAARLAWRAIKTPRAKPEPLRFLIAWAVPAFLLFELLPTKLAHYTLPTYPAIALLCGAGLVAAIGQRWRWTNVAGLALFALAGALLVAVVAYGTTFMPGDEAADMRRAAQAGLLGGALFVGALVAMIVIRAPIARTMIGVVAALAISWSLRERILPEARILLISAEITRALHRVDLEPSAQRGLWVLGYRETSLAFMTRTDIHMPATLDLSGAHPGDAIVIERDMMDAVRGALLARDLDVSLRQEEVRGQNYGNGSDVDLVVGEVVGANMIAPN